MSGRMMARRPAAVVFDLGRVLLDFDYGLVVGRVAAKAATGTAELQRIFLESPLLPAYERGELSSEGFYEAVREATGFRGDYPEFAGYFADIFSEIPPMVALHEVLRASGVPTFIFSNTNALAIEHIRRNFPFFGRFDGYVLSYEHGSMKPSAPLYEVVERLTGRSGADLLYLDDMAENVAAGRDRGWQAIHHVNPADSRSRVAATGLLG
ncbi:MAG: HAD family phosphatase [Verrucomicrobiae bacterium]|nr:HAD family phosphatase [Verrucomicrobiae bacterium]